MECLVTHEMAFVGQKIVGFGGDEPAFEVLTRFGSMISAVDTQSVFRKLQSQDLVSVLQAQLNAIKHLQYAHRFRWSINIDPRLLSEPSLARTVTEIITNANLRLFIEITEIAPLPKNSKTLVQFFRDMHTIGAEIFLDDYGKGYNNHELLRQYEFDGVKIDKTYVDEIDTNSAKIDNLRNLLHKLRKSGLKHIVEGVETQVQLDLLLKIGFQFFQGYHFGKPQPLTELTH